MECVINHLRKIAKDRKRQIKVLKGRVNPKTITEKQIELYEFGKAISILESYGNNS